jgi:hypothetical protein
MSGVSPHILAMAEDNLHFPHNLPAVNLFSFSMTEMVYLHADVSTVLSLKKTSELLTQGILIRIILVRHTSYNVDDLKAPSSATNKVF